MVRTDRVFFAWNAVVSATAIALITFVLRRQSPPALDIDLSFVPAVNAFFNALAAACLAAGWVAIRRGAVSLHRRLMFAAFAFSTAFLIGYLAYHYAHGDTRYTGTGPMRTVYLVVLATHVVLSITVVPCALTAFYFALTRQFDRHRRLNRIFLPIWIYVSITGVAVYFLLRG
jgi:putative membrane protein